jgi:3-isopropylmalate/(R)-2-methylmalate dehydratase small subunit
VIAPSFGTIFFSNCFQNGVLPVILPPEVVDSLAAEVEATQGKGKVTIDLHRCMVISPSGKEAAFTIDAMLRQGMLEGLDQIELTRAREPQIAAFQARDRASYPWIYATPR